MLKANNISKRYGTQEVLSNITLFYEKPEIVAILGPNGSGKSTLLRCLSLIESADSGQLSIIGQNFDFSEEIDTSLGIWPDVTLVFQQFFLWPNLKIRDNILLPLKKRFPDSFQTIFDGIVQQFELEELLNKYPNQISVGQKQKVALARAIALKPKFLFLDEITSALDNLQAAKISSILKQLKEAGTIILLVTHSINFAIHNADSYIVLDKGLLVEQSIISSIFKPQCNYLKNSITENGYLI